MGGYVECGHGWLRVFHGEPAVAESGLLSWNRSEGQAFCAVSSEDAGECYEGEFAVKEKYIMQIHGASSIATRRLQSTIHVYRRRLYGVLL